MKTSLLSRLLALAAVLLCFAGVRQAHAVATNDLMVIAYNSTEDIPVDSIALLATADIPNGTTIFLTDRGWQVSPTASLRITSLLENTVTWVTSGVTAGKIIRIATGTPNNATIGVSDVVASFIGTTYGTLSGSLDPDLTSGDQMLIYTTADNNPDSTPTFIYAFNADAPSLFNSANDDGPLDGWSDSDTTNANNTSKLPAGLTAVLTTGDGGSAFGIATYVNSGADEFDNYIYNGPTSSATRAQWIARITTFANWLGRNSTTYDTQTSGTLNGFAAYSIVSNNADLSALSTTAGSITFAAATTGYALNVPNATATTTVTATRADANATLQVQVNGGGYTSLTSGVASGNLNLNVGANPIEVKVTAQDGTTIKIYTITVTRAAAAVPNQVTNTNDSGAGSLRAVIAAAAPGDTVTFDSSFNSAQTITLTSGQIEISKNLTITGPGADKLTVSGNNNSRIFMIADGNDLLNLNVTITGIKFTQGNGVGPVAPGGGTFTQGGAMFTTENVTLRRCAIVANNCAGSTAGVFFGATTMNSVIDACTFSGNSITNGTSNAGAFLASGGSLAITNSTFSGNHADGSGGAGFIQSGALVTMTNCTVVNNNCTNNGGGGFRATGAGTTLTLKNTIVAGNISTGVPAGNDLNITSSGAITGNNNVIGDAGSSGGLTNGTNGNIVGVSGSGIRALNTIINTTLANNGGPTQTHDLAGSSVALNAGSNVDAISLTTDQRGYTPRAFNTTVDVGALESGATPPSGCPTITVTNPGVNLGTAGTAYSQTFTQSGGAAPVTFTTAQALPTGITLAPNGTLSGIPTQTGTFNITVTATDANLCTGTSGFQLVIACPTIAITNPPVNTGTAGTLYSQNFTNTGGTASYTTPGPLPTGITLATDGTLSGIATQTGVYNITVTATGVAGCLATKGFQLVIACPTMAITNPPVNTGTAGTLYSQNFTNTGGTANYTTPGPLPTGITLATDGTLSGIATQTGVYNITVTATGVAGCLATKGFQLVIACPTIAITNPPVNNGTVGTLYSQTFTNTGGTASYTTSDPLPTGITLATNGTLAGIPTQSGVFNITVTATGVANCLAFKGFQLAIAPPPAPEIAVSGNSQNITDGDVTPSLTDDTDFGSAPVQGVSVTHTFTIANSGTANLTIVAGAITVTGSNAADFTVGGITLPATVNPSGSTTFTVTFDPGALGLRSAMVNIANNDANENPFDFAIQGTGTPPQTFDLAGNPISNTPFDGGQTYIYSLITSEIAIEQPVTNVLTDGVSTVNFGSVEVLGTSALTFTIRNLDLSGTMNLGAITFDGANAGEFSVTTAPAATVGPNSFTTMVVTFRPLNDGARSAAIHIVNDDADENPFDIALTGTGKPVIGGTWPPGTPILTTTEPFDATGLTFDTDLGFVPTIPSGPITFIHSDGGITGQFNDLPDGGVVAMAIGGVIYYFQIDYGPNDITLTPFTPSGPPQWKWVAGPKARSGYGNYGGTTPNIVAPTNNPGARRAAMQWRAADGSLWMFGGYGQAISNPSARWLNDLWQYDRVQGSWIWRGGLNGINSAGTYGSIGTPSASNIPPARHSGSTWTTAEGDFWLFGGTGPSGRFNDLWRYRPSTGEWTWVSGPNTLNGAGDNTGPNFHPSSRQGAATCVAPDGRLYLFGGTGDGTATLFNDLWSFNPDPAALDANTWTRHHGSPSTSPNVNGNYGATTPGTGTATTTPGSRRVAAIWTGPDGHLYLFGGQGFGATNPTNPTAPTSPIGDLNDLWRYNRGTNRWTWLRGSDSINAPGSYGSGSTPGVTNSSIDPPGRGAAASWATVDGKLWLIGGLKNLNAGPVYNDVWIYDTTTGNWTWALGKNTPNTAGNYNGATPPTTGGTPGSRYASSVWVTLNGSIWIFGGSGNDGLNGSGNLSDLWAYSIPPPSGVPYAPSPAPFPDELIVNSAPITSDSSAGTMAYVPVAGQLSATDADRDPLLFSPVGSTQSQGTLQLQANGQWIYTPAPGFIGAATFSFKASDYYGGSSPVRTLLITVVTNPDDSDNDGIADAYEQSVLGGTGADPLGDADLDGQSNYFEYLAGTSPVDAAQSLSTAPSIAAGASTSGAFKLDLNHVRPGVNYHLETSSDLDIWQRIGTFTFSVSGSATLEDPTPPTSQPQFYRVSLETSLLLP